METLEFSQKEIRALLQVLNSLDLSKTELSILELSELYSKIASAKTY